MFLSISDRIKRSRIFFSLKQDSFRKYGISQNYISMIESGKRQPTPQMIEDIYEAFFALTNGEIGKLYTRESFRMTDKENARNFIEEVIENKEQVTSYYNVYYEVALNYDFSDLCNELNMIMGEYYQTLHNYDISTHYLMLATQQAIKAGINLSYHYFLIGTNYGRQLEYDKSLIYFNLAIDYCVDKSCYFYFKVNYMIAHTYFKLKNYSRVEEVVNLITENCVEPGILSLCILFKAVCYSERKDYERAIKVLKDYIDKSPHQGYLYYAYHNLAHCFYLNEKYNESLQMISNAFECQADKLEVSVTQLLEGKVYVALKEVDKAIYCFEECKAGVKLHIQKHFLAEWYEEMIKLFFSLEEYHNVKLLLEEVKELVNDGEFPVTVLKDLKLQLIEYALGMDPLSFRKLEFFSL